MPSLYFVLCLFYLDTFSMPSLCSVDDCFICILSVWYNCFLLMTVFFAYFQYDIIVFCWWLFYLHTSICHHCILSYDSTFSMPSCYSLLRLFIWILSVCHHCVLLMTVLSVYFQYDIIVFCWWLFSLHTSSMILLYSVDDCFICIHPYCMSSLYSVLWL